MIANKIEAIKVVRQVKPSLQPVLNEPSKFQITCGLGLKEAKDLVEDIMALGVQQFLENPKDFINNNPFYRKPEPRTY